MENGPGLKMDSLLIFGGFSSQPCDRLLEGMPLQRVFHRGLFWVWRPPRMPVTTRIISFLGSGIQINLHLPLLLGGGHTQGLLELLKSGSNNQVFVHRSFVFFPWVGRRSFPFWGRQEAYFQVAIWYCVKCNSPFLHGSARIRRGKMALIKMM